MFEIKDKRQLNSKTFDLENGKKKLESHAGHIFFVDKLGDKSLKEIGWKLNFNDTKKGWGFNTHSFHPFFPEYSDGFAEFRDLFDGKDQTIRYKAVGAKVKGVLIDTDDTNPNFDDNKDNKAVLYKDAFGKGRDYILYHTRSSMVKVATVNNPNEQTTDAKFRWEIEFPKENLKELSVYRTESKEKLTKEFFSTPFIGIKTSYKLDLTKEKIFDTAKQTLIGEDKKDGKEWFTYLKGYKAWDSEGNTINVEARIFEENGKRYLEKTIPLSFLKTAKGRVFTDTTTSYYAGSGDGFAYYKQTSTITEANWNTAHDATSCYSVDTTSANHTFGAGAVQPYEGFRISRVFWPIDTSGLGSSVTISSASLKIYGYAVGDAGYTESYLGMVQTTQPSTSGLTTADWDLCGDVDNPTQGATAIDLGSWNTSGYNSLALNSTGIGWINKTGYTKLGTRVGRDLEDVYYSSGNDWATCYFSEYTGTDHDPYLEVTYSAGTTATDDANFFGMNF